MGQYGISEVKKAIDVLVDVGLLVEDAVTKNLGKGLGDLMTLIMVLQVGLNLQELSKEMLELDGQEKVDVLAYLSQKLPALKMPDLEAKLVQVAGLVSQLDDLVRANVAYVQKVEAVIKGA